MSHLNHLAPGVNAYTLAFDDGLLEELRHSYQDVVSQRIELGWLQGGESRSGRIDHQDWSFSFTANLLGTYPLIWVSSNNQYTYGIFRRFFESLNIVEEVKQLVDCDTRIVVYCGFFIMGNYANEEAWHVDYKSGSNGFTLLTPLLEPHASHGNLLYYDQNSEVKTYEYRAQEAILFGDNFYHSTETYARSENIRVLLCLTVGTDKMKYWPKLEETVGRQSEFVILPCGDQKGTCDHLGG